MYAFQGLWKKNFHYIKGVVIWAVTQATFCAMFFLFYEV